MLNQEIRKRRLTGQINAMYSSLFGNLSPSDRNEMIAPMMAELRYLTGEYDAVPEIDHSGIANLKKIIGGTRKSALLAK